MPSPSPPNLLTASKELGPMPHAHVDRDTVGAKRAVRFGPGVHLDVEKRNEMRHAQLQSADAAPVAERSNHDYLTTTLPHRFDSLGGGTPVLRISSTTRTCLPATMSS